MKGPETQGHELNRASLSLQIGDYVGHRSSVYRLIATVDFSHVMGIDVIVGTSKLLPIAELIPAYPNKVRGAYANYSLDSIADADWAEAERRMAVILPLLQGGMYRSSAVDARAKECSVSRATLYRWLEAYSGGNQFLGLMPRKRGWKKGVSRITGEVERLIANTINVVYMTTSRGTKKDVHDHVKDLCKTQGLIAPSIPTVSRRIGQVPRRLVLIARGYSDIARDTYDAEPGQYEADYPLQRIQIDHTPADVIIVDDEYRLPIGRPHVTLAIDMYSRMIVGYFVSLDAPSIVSVAMCLVHTMLPKHRWLNLHGIDSEWNAWGKPAELHTDNGPDFKTKSLRHSCQIHQIEQMFRPKDRPNWGGHIEALMNTKARAFATLPGATARSIEERGEVNSSGEAVVSFAAFEKWFIAQIIIYNNKSHSSIGFMPPAKKWHHAFFGGPLGKPICGLPPVPQDPLTLEIDFLPALPRTVQTYGVEWDAFYYAEVLRPYIGLKDPDTNRAARLLFRRDPRDINCIWFFEPIEKKYHRIPITSGPFPGTSVVAYKKAKLAVKKLGLSLEDDVEIKKMIAFQRQIVADELAKSKKSRRQRQSEINKAKGTTPAKTYVELPYTNYLPAPTSEPATSASSPEWGDDDEVEAYGGIA